MWGNKHRRKWTIQKRIQTVHLLKVGQNLIDLALLTNVNETNINDQKYESINEILGKQEKGAKSNANDCNIDTYMISLEERKNQIYNIINNIITELNRNWWKCVL